MTMANAKEPTVNAKFVAEKVRKVLKIQEAFILTSCSMLEDDGANPQILDVLRKAAKTSNLINEFIAKLLEDNALTRDEPGYRYI
jgi:hypothetical protein